MNNARVLSSYTDSRTATQNGLLEWDAVDSNVNMPILNYKVNVNLPVYDPPSVYGPVMITNSGSYNIEDFVNADLTDYTWVNKDIPVIINTPSGFDGTVYTIKIGSTTVANSQTNGHWTFYSSYGSTTLGSGKELIVITKGTDNLYLIDYMLNNTSSQSISYNANSWVYIYDITSSSSSSSYTLDFYGSSNDILIKLFDANTTDDYIVRVKYNMNMINFSGINWMTFN